MKRTRAQRKLERRGSEAAAGSPAPAFVPPPRPEIPLPGTGDGGVIWRIVGGTIFLSCALFMHSPPGQPAGDELGARVFMTLFMAGPCLVSALLEARRLARAHRRDAGRLARWRESALRRASAAHGGALTIGEILELIDGTDDEANGVLADLAERGLATLVVNESGLPLWRIAPPRLG